MFVVHVYTGVGHPKKKTRYVFIVCFVLSSGILKYVLTSIYSVLFCIIYLRFTTGSFLSSVCGNLRLYLFTLLVFLINFSFNYYHAQPHTLRPYVWASLSSWHLFRCTFFSFLIFRRENLWRTADFSALSGLHSTPASDPGDADVDMYSELHATSISEAVVRSRFDRSQFTADDGWNPGYPRHRPSFLNATNVLLPRRLAGDAAVPTLLLSVSSEMSTYKVQITGTKPNLFFPEEGSCTMALIHGELYFSYSVLTHWRNYAVAKYRFQAAYILT